MRKPGTTLWVSERGAALLIVVLCLVPATAWAEIGTQTIAPIFLQARQLLYAVTIGYLGFCLFKGVYKLCHGDHDVVKYGTNVVIAIILALIIEEVLGLLEGKFQL